MTAYQSSKPANKEKRNHHTKASTTEIDLDKPGQLRIADLMAILEVSHSTIYDWLNRKNMRARAHPLPPPDGYNREKPWWNTSTIKAFIEAAPAEQHRRRLNEVRMQLAGFDTADMTPESQAEYQALRSEARWLTGYIKGLRLSEKRRAALAKVIVMT